MHNSTAASAPLILVGAGHAHLLALRQWLDQGYTPPPGSILVNPDPAAWYSGMLPGLIAGRYHLDDCALPLDPLCTRLGLRLLQGQMTAFNADQKTLQLDSGLDLRGDIVSFNAGSQPAPIPTDDSLPLIPVKPFPAFIEQWQHWRSDTAARHISVIGGGAAAFEIALALAASLPESRLQLLCAGTLLPGHSPMVVKRARQWLQNQHIRLHEHCRVTRLQDGQLWHDDQCLGSADATILATGASAHPWQGKSGLSTDERGFIRIDPQLRSLSHPDVFASGDCASLPGSQKSGVYAVRQGPILAHNLKALLQGEPLHGYQPQPQALALLATGDGGALLSYGQWGAGGKVFGFWKDHLDQGFMQRQRLCNRNKT
ncbi:FAD-dependent oxidoreductase [Halopseudomonas salegens]|nr:FAD-dependent oxidoreductase [Halopseudomonas salegens]